MRKCDVQHYCYANRNVYGKEITPIYTPNQNKLENHSERIIMAKLNMKGKPLLLMVDGELFGVEEISRNQSLKKIGQTNAKFLTIKAINVTGEKKLTIHIDPRIINALKEENKVLPYIQ
ncbi:MAG: hypothetical protein JSV12_08990 [Candidatus Bathyarchaeota archaeon]|nr:MAG: hypothetical protein JSV12_08990 [Candidatus Bathyarchaeota archaeon]